MQDTARLFVNGKIWQWECSAGHAVAGNANAQWMLVDANGKIEAIGDATTPLPVVSVETEHIDLGGALVLPGMHDSHLHVYSIGESAAYLDLVGCPSYEALAERLKTYAEAHPHKKWIIGCGWEQDRLSSGARYPSRHDLDAVVSDGPVLLHRVCWHIAVANTRALELAGIDVHSTDHVVESGAIDVDEHGATGILREDAVHLVEKCIEAEADDIRLSYLHYALQECVRHGLTAVHTNDHHAWQLYKKIENDSTLPVRVYLTLPYDEIGTKDAPAPGARVGRLSCDRIKLFTDGSLGAETAALRLPYRGTNNYGILMLSDSVLTDQVATANAAGFRVEIHAIGDRAAEQVLQALQVANVPPKRRPILTHCQILGPDLMAQMNDQHVIANIQPSFVVTDAVFAQKRLPDDLLEISYCWKTMLKKHSIVCAGGSDAPIETCNPFQGMYDAIYRCKPNDKEHVFHSHECVDFAQALALYTLNGAFTANDEQRLGQLTPGFQADFVVLRYNVVNNHEALVRSDLVKSVWIDGKSTYSSSKA